MVRWLAGPDRAGDHPTHHHHEADATDVASIMSIDEQYFDAPDDPRAPISWETFDACAGTTMIPAADAEALFHGDGSPLSESGWARVAKTHDSDSRWETPPTLVLRDPHGRHWGVPYSL